MKTILTSLVILTSLAGSLMAQSSRVTKLTVSDTVNLRISGVPTEDATSISSPYTIGEDGKISLAYIGRITAAGLTPSQLGVRIEQAYKESEIFTRPTVTIATKDQETIGRLVTVVGEVRAPIRTPFTEGMTMLDAIASAGGFTDWADKRRVRLIRNNRTTEHDFTRITDDFKQNFALQPDDRIIVIHR